MTDIPEWAAAEARETFLLLERTPDELKARVRQGAYDADPHLIAIARVLVATAERVEREMREREYQVCAGCTGRDAREALVGMDPTDLAEKLGTEIAELPLKYGEK